MKNKENQLRVILSGGGTGGHIYPAIAIAKEIMSRNADAEILFVGAKDKMEMQKVPQAGFKIKGLWIAGLQRKLTLKNLLFPVKLLVSLLHSLFILLRFRPNIVIGTGGFASGAVLKMASLLKIPTVIQEQNSYPGITNKLLSKKAEAICVAYEGLETFFPKDKVILTGNPVRSDLLNLSETNEEALTHFNLTNDKKTVLVLGGSLGARRINQLIEKELDFFEQNNIQLIWQCGKLYKNDYFKYNSKSVIVLDFIDRMDLAYIAADFIISRSGASSVSELCLIAKPTIYIPSPNVAEDHQTKNAQAIASKNGAILIKEKDLDTQFKSQITSLFKDVELQKELAKNSIKLALPNATNDIVNTVEAIINKQE